MIPEENQSVLGVLITGAVAAVGFVGMWIWNHTMGRIRALERDKVDRQTFTDYTQAAETSRRELRESFERTRTEQRNSIIGLYEKFDEVKDMIRDIGK